MSTWVEGIASGLNRVADDSRRVLWVVCESLMVEVFEFLAFDLCNLSHGK